MNTKRLKLLGLVLIFTFLLVGHPARAVVEKTSYWGTAARAMGGAYTAVGGDFGGITYNPANSATIQFGQFVTDYNQLSQRSVQVSNSALGSGFRSGDFVHGGALYRASLEHDFGNFDLTSDDLNLEYDDDIYYYNLSWNYASDIHLGTNVKLYSVTTDVEGGNASGYGLDLGYLQFLNEQLSFGFALKNLVGSKDWDSGVSEDVPMEARLGARLRPVPEMAVEADLVYGENPGLRSLNIGGEWWLWRELEDPAPSYRRPYFLMQRQAKDRIKYGLALRAGVKKEMAGAENTNFSFGLGMRFGGGQLDYSFQQRSNFDNQHYFGFSTAFGAAPGEEESTFEEQPTTTSTNRYSESSESAEKQSSGLASAEQSLADSSQPAPAKEVELGLLQWLTPEEVKFPAELLQGEFALETGYNLTVYEQRRQLQRMIIEADLSGDQIKSLLDSTNKDYLITGRLRSSGGEFRGSAYLLHSENQKIFTGVAESKRKLARTLFKKINQYLTEQRQSAQKQSGQSRQKLTLPVSVKVGLLEWITGPETDFNAEKLRAGLSDIAGLDSDVYAADYSLQRALVENALTTKQYRQLLAQANKDMLITGQLKRATDGYTATAYIIRSDQNYKVEVQATSKREVVEKLSRTLDSRLSS